jgi:hypothetical protein
MITAPTDISNCQVWLDASDTTSLFQLSGGTTAVAANLDPVGYWGDKSGNARHFTNIGGSATTRPTWVSSLSTVRFDGTNDYLSSFFNLTYTAQTVFVVCKGNSPSNAAFYSQKTLAVSDADQTAAGNFVPLVINDASTWAALGAAITFSPRNPSTLYDLVTIYHTGSQATSFLNGSLRLSVADALNYNVGLSRIGARITTNSVAGTFLLGDISEVIVYNRALTNNERADVEYYLTRKWNFLNSIPRQTYAIKNGLWSDSATWSVSAEPSPWNFPLSADNAYTNTFTVTADSSTKVDTIRNSTLAPNILSGGSFVLANGVSLSANLGTPTTGTTLLSSSVSTSSSVLGVSATTGTRAAGSNVCIHNGIGNVTLSYPNFANNNDRGFVVANIGTGSVFLSGSVFVGSSNGSAEPCYLNTSSGSLNIIGNVSMTNNRGSGQIQNTGTGTLLITGDVIGAFSGSAGANVASAAVGQSGAGSTKIVGNVVGAGSPGVGVSNGRLELIGSVSSGYLGLANPGILNTTTGVVSITGNVGASNSANGYSSSITSFVPLSVYGNILNAPNGTQAIYAPRYQVFPSASATYTRQAVNGYDSFVDYWTSNATFSYPASSDVVLSTVYSNNTLSGSMALPPASAVALGASVGTTLGTASITLEGLLNQSVATLNTPNSIGARLKNVATTQALSAVANSLDFNN